MELQQVTENIPQRFRGVEIITGKQMAPLKIIFYGDNGVGKSETLAQSKNTIIADMEGNCGHIESSKSQITNLAQYNELLDYLLHEQHDYNSLLNDSLDSIETFLNQEIENKFSKTQLEYGRDSKILKGYAQNILEKLDKLHKYRRMNILFTAHLKTKSANNPMVENYDRYDLSIHEVMKTVFCNWVQCICFFQKDVIIDEKNKGEFNKKKAKDVDRRVLYTRGTPTYYGKNVFNLPERIFMETAEDGWKNFIKNVNKFYSN